MSLTYRINVKRKFTDDSKLYKYLTYKYPSVYNIEQNLYTIKEILINIYKTIISEKLYDLENPIMIILNKELEDALNVRILHLGDFLSFIEKQMIIHITDDMSFTSMNTPPIKNYITCNDGSNYIIPVWASKTANAVIARKLKVANFDIEKKYKVKSNFLKVLKSVDDSITKTIFFYREIIDLFNQYIIINKKTLVDDRNTTVFIVENDLLGQAFGVQTFSKKQLSYLIQNQLILVTDEEINYENTYRVEFEVFSEDEESNETSGCSTEPENTEIDIKFRLKNNDDFINWADSEYSNDNTEIKLTKTNETKNCTICKKNIDIYTNYCKDCWDTRKLKFPDRKRPKVKKYTQNKIIKIDIDNDEKNNTSHDIKNITPLCKICYINPANGIYIHKKTGHQYSCYKCSKEIFKKQNCPICKQSIEKVIRLF